MAVHYETDGAVAVVTLDRLEVANAIDRPTAAALADAFRRFEADEALAVAVLTGANGKFCCGADLKAMRSGDPERISRVTPDGDGPVGPTRGKARISIDGTVVATVDLRRSRFSPREVLFKTSWKRVGEHTLTITVIGNGRPVAIDEFVITR